MRDIVATEDAGNTLPTRRELAAQLDRLAMPADAKVLMARLLDTIAEVAGRIVEIGRRVLAFVLDLVRRFPSTTLGAVVGMTVTFLIGSIPLLGMVLGPLLGPLLAAFMLTQGALADMHDSAIDRQLALFGARLDAALAHG